MTAALIVGPLAVGAVIGRLCTRGVSRHQLDLAKRRGLIEGRQERSRQVAFLNARVAHLEAAARRLGRTGGA